jgi:hypothetical protein
MGWRKWVAFGLRVGEVFVPGVAAKGMDKAADVLEVNEAKQKAEEKAIEPEEVL